MFVEIFPVSSAKKACNSGVYAVQGHPRSLILVQIESA